MLPILVVPEGFELLAGIATLAAVSQLVKPSPAADVTPAPGDAPALAATPAGIMPGLGPVCPSLPSSKAAFALVSGDWSALPNVIASTALRAALIGAGMALLGEREHLARNSIGGALGIEAFVLAWAWHQVRGPGRA